MRICGRALSFDFQSSVVKGKGGPLTPKSASLSIQDDYFVLSTHFYAVDLALAPELTASLNEVIKACQAPEMLCVMLIVVEPGADDSMYPSALAVLG